MGIRRVLLIFLLAFGVCSCQYEAKTFQIDSTYIVSRNNIPIGTLKDLCRDAGNVLVVWLDAECSSCLFSFTEWEEFAEKYSFALLPVYIVSTRHIELFNLMVESWGREIPYVIHDEGFRTVGNGVEASGRALILNRDMNIVGETAGGDIRELDRQYRRYKKI